MASTNSVEKLGLRSSTGRLSNLCCSCRSPWMRHFTAALAAPWAAGHEREIASGTVAREKLHLWKNQAPVWKNQAPVSSELSAWEGRQLPPLFAPGAMVG